MDSTHASIVGSAPAQARRQCTAKSGGPVTNYCLAAYGIDRMWKLKDDIHKWSDEPVKSSLAI